MFKLRLTCLSTLIFFCAGTLSAQRVNTSPVIFEGSIVDGTTQELISASIQYQSLPYGSKIGVFTGSKFTIHMEDNKDYDLQIEAEGYAPYNITLKASEFFGHVQQTIELQPIKIDQLIRLDKLIFGLGKADISDASYEELDELATMLNENENIIIQLEGHTDFRGNARQNMKLSEERVEAVRNYLVKRGVNKKRIITKAFGGSKPLSRAGDSDSRRSNRRVEVRILSN